MDYRQRNAGTKDLIVIEVAYAWAEGCDRVTLTVPPQTTLREAINLSGLAERHAEIDAENTAAGVFGRVRSLDDCVSAGDRVEIYRGLRADPKQARRHRVRMARRKLR